MTNLHFRIKLQPVPKQSFRATKYGGYQTSKIKNYEHEIKKHVLSQIPDRYRMPEKDFPVEISYIFAYKLLKKHKNKNIDYVKLTTPDIDNLIKPVNDALQGLIFYQDQQINKIKATKIHSNDYGIYLDIRF